jgi:hypothetical protein
MSSRDLHWRRELDERTCRLDAQCRPTRRLEWPDEDQSTKPPTAELRAAQVAFWAKVAPPVFDTRVVDDPTSQELDWG